MPLSPFIKRVVTALALTAAVPGIGAAPAVAHSAAPLGQCAVSVSNPNHAGNYVWGESKWNCSTLPADGGAKIHLRIIRDGAVVKTSEFWQNGPFSNSFGTGVACVGGSHVYQVHAWGFDSDLIQYHAYSQKVTLPC